MAHDKVYGFCEAKCKVEVLDKATFEECIPKDGTAGQVWASDGSGAGKWVSKEKEIYTGTLSDLMTKDNQNVGTLVVHKEFDIEYIHATASDADNPEFYITRTTVPKGSYSNVMYIHLGCICSSPDVYGYIICRSTPSVYFFVNGERVTMTQATTDSVDYNSGSFYRLYV